MVDTLYTDGPAPPEYIEFLVWEHFHRPPEEIGPRRILEFLTVRSEINKWTAEQYKHG